MPRRLPIFAFGLAVGIISTLGVVAGPWLPTQASRVSGGAVDGTSSPGTTLAATEFRDSDPRAHVGRIVETSPPLSEALQAVVRVRTRTAAGSGVIIDPAGLVLTSAHLLGDSLSAQVVVEDTRTVVGMVIHLDKLRDLALLQLPPGNYPSARLGRSSDIVLGAWVSAIGYPLNLAGPATITTGVVSRLLDEPESRREVLQTDAAIHIGSSGGPIVGSNGEVIGIIASVLGEYKSFPTSGISYAVSVKTIRDDFLDEIGLDP